MADTNSYPNDSLEAQRLRAEMRSPHLSGEILELFSTAGCGRSYLAGSPFVVEGDAASMIQVLVAGRAKLYTRLDDGRDFVLRIALPGEVLGLDGALSGKPYEVTAEALTKCLAFSVTRQDFIRVLLGHPQACLRVCEMLSRHYRIALEEARILAR